MLIAKLILTNFELPKQLRKEVQTDELTAFYFGNLVTWYHYFNKISPGYKSLIAKQMKANREKKEQKVKKVIENKAINEPKKNNKVATEDPKAREFLINTKWRRLVNFVLKNDKMRHLEIYGRLIQLVQRYICFKTSKEPAKINILAKNKRKLSKKQLLIDKKYAAINRWTRFMKKLLKKHPNISICRNFIRFTRFSAAKKQKYVTKANNKL
jgi:hypothetical protein